MATTCRFLEWRDKALYRFSPRLGVDGVYTGALFAFAEMALHGVTTVCDFFYLNDGGNSDNARAVIARGAHRRSGSASVDDVRSLGTIYDWEGAPKMYREPKVKDAHEALPRAARRVSRPHAMCSSVRRRISLHGASEEMIRAGVDAARRVGTRWHIHLAEEKYQGRRRQEALRHDAALRAIDKMGLLGDDMVAVHGCWFDAEERALLAERGAKLAYNPNSNMFLGDGVTDVVDLVARGARVALGTDGGCSNSRVSVFDEMRACACSCRRWWRVPTGRRSTPRRLLRHGDGVGRRSAPGCQVGRLAVGQRADIVFVDLDDPSLWPEQSLAKNVVYLLALGARRHRRLRRRCARWYAASRRAWCARRSAESCNGACARCRTTGDATSDWQLALLDEADDLDVPGLRHHVDGPGDARRASRRGAPASMQIAPPASSGSHET